MGWKIAGGILAFIVLILGFSLGMGWFDVFYTKTVGKAKQNAQTEVFKETQSFTDGKLQEITKLRLEYMKGDSVTKTAIKSALVHSLANVDEDKWYDDGKINRTIYQFIVDMKYN